MSEAVPAGVRVPSGWGLHALGRIAPRSKAAGTPNLQPLSVFLGAGVVPRADRDDNHNQLGDDLAKYLTVQPGDVVFNKLRTWQGGLGVSKYEGIVSPAYFVLRPAPAVLPRFLHYLLLSAPYLAELTRRSKWMPPSQFDIGWDSLKTLPVPVPLLEVQQRIADFLDDQVNRIDGIVELRGAQLEALGERESGLLNDALAALGWEFPNTLDPDWPEVRTPNRWRVARLSQVLNELTNGYVGPTRDILEESGIRYIQSLHIKDGEIDFERRHFFVSPEWHRARPRIALRPGDVLIVQTGDLGQVACVPEDFGRASCHALLIARVRSFLITPGYLTEYLRSPFGQHSLLSRATGALHPHLEGSIRAVPVLLPSLAQQDAVVNVVDRERRALRSVATSIREQVGLLQERKRALITAAVTGEFDVTTASTRAADAVLA